MNRNLTTTLIGAALALTFASPSMADARADLLAQYASAAKAADPAFKAFSVERGKAMHSQTFSGGKPATPSCSSCHGTDPRAAGHNPTGKVIEAMAVSVTPARYTDPAKVEKWFKRNCNEVMGRECSATEKGDWLSFVMCQ